MDAGLLHGEGALSHTVIVREDLGRGTESDGGKQERSHWEARSPTP